jgi:hypothetical protein
MLADRCPRDHAHGSQYCFALMSIYASRRLRKPTNAATSNSTVFPFYHRFIDLSRYANSSFIVGEIVCVPGVQNKPRSPQQQLPSGLLRFPARYQSSKMTSNSCDLTDRSLLNRIDELRELNVKLIELPQVCAQRLGDTSC